VYRNRPGDDLCGGARVGLYFRILILTTPVSAWILISPLAGLISHLFSDFKREGPMKNKIELLGNVSIAILCLTVSGILIKGHFFSEQPPEPTQATAKGEVLDLPAKLTPGDAEFVVIAALAPACGFCNESMPFYRTLSDRISAEESAPRFVAAVRQLDHAEEESRKLKAAGVAVDEIVVTDFKALGVPGTPMLIVADRRGEVHGVWLGKLDKNKEQEVLDTLGLQESIAQASLPDGVFSNSAATDGR
jgi:hypothetical protein